MKIHRAPLVAVSLLILLSACSGGSNSSPAVPTVVDQSTGAHAKSRPADTLGGVGGRLSILLGDAPPTIGSLTPTAINLGIDSVAVVSNGQVITLAQYPTPYVVNVLAYQDTSSPIGIGQYYSGTYQQLQFTFDVATSQVVAGGQNYPITFLPGNAQLSSAGAGATTSTTANVPTGNALTGNAPAGSASPGSAATGSAPSVTVTVSGNFTIDGYPAATVKADFNALESLAPGPNGSIVSRPTMFAVPGGLSGGIAGTVLSSTSGAPVSGAVVVALDQNGNVDNTVATAADGTFFLHTLAAGAYTLVVYNTYTTASGQVLNATGNGSTATSVTGPSTTVTAAQATQVGTIAD